MVGGDGATCGWCGGLGHHNGLFEVNVEVEGKTFTTPLTDVDGAYRFAPSTTGFSRTLLVEVVGEAWRWALEPEWSGWAPMEQEIVSPVPPAGPARRAAGR